MASACFLLGHGFALADNIYVSNFTNNTIEMFNSTGQGSLFANTGLSGPAGLAFDSGGNLYVANSGANTIKKYDTSGNGSTFASSGLYGPAFIAAQVPEPASWALVTLGAAALLGGRCGRRRKQ